MRQNPIAPLVDKKNKRESVELMEDYYVVGVTAIPYLGFGVIINIVFKHDIIYHVTIDDDHKNILSCTGKKKNGCIVKIFIMCLGFCARWTTRVTNSFMHPHIPIMRSCDYLKLLILYNVSSIASVLSSNIYLNVNK